MQRTVYSAIALVVLALVASFALRGLWVATALAFMLGCLWAVGEWRRIGSAPTLGLLGCVAACVYGAFERVSLFGLLVAIVAALVAWDGANLLGRLRSAGDVAFGESLVQAHRRRMLTVAGVGLLAGLLALVVRVPLNFDWALVLGIIATIGLVSAVRFFQRESDK